MSKAKINNPTDVHIGNRVRARRMMLGMSQETLGGKIGVTFQQIQKYEHGSNRVGGSRMHQIAGALGIGEAFFFEGLASPDKPGEKVPDFVGAFMATSDGVALARIWLQLSAGVRRRMVDLAETVAAAS